MDAKKYNRSVGLHCPTCGADQFEFEGSDEAVETVCASCGREFTKDDLIQENRENISEHVKAMGNGIARERHAIRAYAVPLS